MVGRREEKVMEGRGGEGEKEGEEEGFFLND